MTILEHKTRASKYFEEFMLLFKYKDVKSNKFYFTFKIFIYLFIWLVGWLRWVLVAACVWDLDP